MYIRASIEAKLILGSILAFAWAAPASATLFQVRPLLLPDGYSISGTITTDGAVGSLGASDITAWSISVSQVTTLLDLTKSNSSALLSQVSVGASGRLNVATSADGSADGGLLQFGSYPRYVSVADFTGINASGGAVAYRLGRTGTTAPLGQPNASLYQAAVATMPGRFVVPTQLIDGTSQDGIFLSGWMTTTVNSGALSAADLTGWDIRIQQGWNDVFTNQNSTLDGFLAGLSVSADGTRMMIANPDGELLFSQGIVSGHLHALSLANFTDGQNSAGYYFGRSIFSELSPLTNGAEYLVASVGGVAVPAPGGTPVLAGAVLVAIVSWAWGTPRRLRIGANRHPST